MGAKVLSRERFLEVAVAYADRGELEGLTLRQLGEDLDVDATAVYRYFRSKSDLLVAVLGVKLGETMAAAAAEGLEDEAPLVRLEHLVMATRSTLMAYPGLAAALAGMTEAPRANADMTVVACQAIQELGYEPREALLRYQMLESYLVGSALFDSSSYPHHWAIRADRYRSSGVPGAREVGASEDDVRDHSEEAFRTGVEAMLAAIAAGAPSRS